MFSPWWIVTIISIILCAPVSTFIPVFTQNVMWQHYIDIYVHVVHHVISMMITGMKILPDEFWLTFLHKMWLKFCALWQHSMNLNWHVIFVEYTEFLIPCCHNTFNFNCIFHENYELIKILLKVRKTVFFTDFPPLGVGCINHVSM
jgi:hypothetical protein